MIVVVVATLVACAPPPAGFGFAAVPTATFDTDEGFGTGGVATIYHYDGATEPYRDAVTLNVFISSKLVQSHGVTWDALRPFDVDGRLYVRLGYYSTVSENYCGVGNDVTCASPANTSDEAARRFTLMRFIKPYATVIARPWLRADKPYRVELMLGWRGFLLEPGDLFAANAVDRASPYPSSLYARDFPGGEQGFESVPFVGAIVDDRDDETFPARGLYAEASVRGAHPVVGSSWTWAGANAQLASYFTLLSAPPDSAPNADPRVVLATRVIGDVIVGDPPVVDMARIGGTVDAISFGGAQLGRGIREERYVGRVKAIAQAELRAQLFDHVVLDQELDHGVAAFSDVGFIGKSVDDLGARPLKLLSTVGVSYRLLWNKTFAIRADLAVSPDEDDGPGFYVIVGQLF